MPALDAEDVEDLEDAPDNEVEAAEEEILDEATAARSIAELRIEIETLKRLEALALTIRRSGDDKKSGELANLLSEIFARAVDRQPAYRRGCTAPCRRAVHPETDPIAIAEAGPLHRAPRHTELP